MKIAAYLLQTIYGGEDKLTPLWLKNFSTLLQKMNHGYHPGRFINCIEVSLIAFKTILENKGNYLPAVSPLPTLPPFIPNYMERLEQRIQSLDTEEPLIVRNIESYGELNQYIINYQIPLYSHLLVQANLKLLPGGHAFSGIIAPDEQGLPKIYFYDAQGFLPEAWLHPEEFDKFYTLENVYIHQSSKTLTAIAEFIRFCQKEDLHMHALAPIDEDTNSFAVLLQQRLQAYLFLEYFRLQANFIICSEKSEFLQKKLHQYETLVEEIQNSAILAPEKLAKLIIEISSIAKQHVYSFNWFNPQSFTHFLENSKELISHQKYEGPLNDLTAIRNYVNVYLLKEILRLAQRNDSSTYTLDKMKRFTQIATELNGQPLSGALISQILERIQHSSKVNCHWLGMLSVSTSALNFNNYIQPIYEKFYFPINNTLTMD